MLNHRHQCSIKQVHLYRPWQEEEAEAAPSYPRPRPVENPVSHPSVPWNHRFRCYQGSDACQGCPPRLRSGPSQETPLQR